MLPSPARDNRTSAELEALDATWKYNTGHGAGINTAWSGVSGWKEATAAVRETVDAGSAYVFAMNEFERRWGEYLVPVEDSMSRNLIAIINEVQKAARDDGTNIVLKTFALIQHGGRLITEIERHWGKIGGQDASVGEDDEGQPH